VHTRQHSSLLLRRAKTGSVEAADEVMREVGDKLLALIRLRLGPALRARFESRDILQATLLKGFEHFHEFEGSGKQTLMGWLAIIASNEIRDHAKYHHRARRDLHAEAPLDALAASREVAERVRSEVSRISLKRDLQLLEESLERLEESQREVIVLRKLEELTFPEIGERMGRSAEACRKLFSRAMIVLSEEMVSRRPA
jgi:RNA polymerase sigma-70 factor (ECF subfamily)